MCNLSWNISPKFGYSTVIVCFSFRHLLSPPQSTKPRNRPSSVLGIEILRQWPHREAYQLPSILHISTQKGWRYRVVVQIRRNPVLYRRRGLLAPSMAAAVHHVYVPRRQNEVVRRWVKTSWGACCSYILSSVILKQCLYLQSCSTCRISSSMVYRRLWTRGILKWSPVLRLRQWTKLLTFLSTAIGSWSLAAWSTTASPTTKKAFSGWSRLRRSSKKWGRGERGRPNQRGRRGLKGGSRGQGAGRTRFNLQRVVLLAGPETPMLHEDQKWTIDEAADDWFRAFACESKISATINVCMFLCLDAWGALYTANCDCFKPYSYVGCPCPHSEHKWQPMLACKLSYCRSASLCHNIGNSNHLILCLNS